MQNYCKTIGALAAASALVAGNASAIEIDYELSAGYTSEYVWRGINLGQDLTEVGINAATEINGVGLSAGVWYGSVQDYPGYDTGGDESWNEIDLYIEGSYDLGFATVALGFITYQFQDSYPIKDDDVDDAREIYLSLSRDFGFVEASLTHYFDLETDNDGYTELGVSNSTELTDCLTLSTSSALGYLVEEGDFTHIQLKVALDYAISESATISPFIAHSWSLSEGGTQHVGTALYENAKNQLFAGCLLSVGF